MVETSVTYNSIAEPKTLRAGSRPKLVNLLCRGSRNIAPLTRVVNKTFGCENALSIAFRQGFRDRTLHSPILFCQMSGPDCHPPQCRSYAPVASQPPAQDAPPAQPQAQPDAQQSSQTAPQFIAVVGEVVRLVVVAAHQVAQVVAMVAVVAPDLLAILCAGQQLRDTALPRLRRLQDRMKEQSTLLSSCRTLIATVRHIRSLKNIHIFMFGSIFIR